MKSNMKNFKSMTPAEKRTEMQSTMQDLKNWATQNNIPLQYLRPFGPGMGRFGRAGDRKSTRLNSSHQIISYAVFCLKKKNNKYCKHTEFRTRLLARALSCSR